MFIILVKKRFYKYQIRPLDNFTIYLKKIFFDEQTHKIGDLKKKKKGINPKQV
jgi:hypothetical protein